MLADQFAAGAAARNTAAVDGIARLTWRAHAEGQIIDAEAEAISEALQSRRAALATGGEGPYSRQGQPLGFLGPPNAHAPQIVKPRSSAGAAKP
jgi:hypothetical protein